MTKVISLSGNQPPISQPEKHWPITFMSNGFFYSGSVKSAYAMFYDFSQQALPIKETISYLENLNDIKVDLYLTQSEFIEKDTLYQPQYNQRIEVVPSKAQDILFTIQPTPITSDNLEEIWMDKMMNSDDYEVIGDFMIENIKTTKLFIDNVNHAYLCEAQANGRFDQSYLDELQREVKAVTSFDMCRYQEYLNRGNPKETYEFMGLQL